MSEPIIGTGRETSGVPVQWGASQDHTACGDAIAAAGAAGARDALLSLAADLDRYADETSAEADAHAARGDDDAGIMAAGASGAWRAAAGMARLRVRGGQSATSGPLPVSQDAPDGSGQLSGAADIPAEVVAAALRADHEEGIRDGRSYHQVAEHQVRRLIAGAVKAERERCAQLAESVGAGYEKRRPCKCGQRTCRGVLLDSHAPFADLIREQP